MGRDAAQVLHQVQDHSLATQQYARIVADDGQHLSLVDAHAIENLRMADDLKARLGRGPRIEPRKDLEEARHRAEAGDDHLLRAQ